MPAASLALLKGKKGDAAAAEAPKTQPEAAEPAKTEGAAQPKKPNMKVAKEQKPAPKPKAAEPESAEQEAKTVDSVPQEAANVPAPAQGKTATSKESAKATKALSGEIVDPDDLTDIVHLVENLKEKDARELVGKLAESAEFTFFKLGGVLSVIQANGWYEPYASFREYVESEHGINYRRATYWISIYNDLSAAKIPWEKVKNLGWTKLKEIAAILTPENVDHWVKIAEQQTTLQLIETVADAKKAGEAGDTKALADQSKVVTTRTFKVHEDQKKTIDAAIAKAKEMSGVQTDTAALEFICLDFIGSAKKPASLKEVLKQAGVEAAVNALGEAFPDVNFTVEMPEAAE